jgi:hypothetical protein
MQLRPAGYSRAGLLYNKSLNHKKGHEQRHQGQQAQRREYQPTPIQNGRFTEGNQPRLPLLVCFHRVFRKQESPHPKLGPSLSEVDAAYRESGSPRQQVSNLMRKRAGPREVPSPTHPATSGTQLKREIFTAAQMQSPPTMAG